jgi:Archaeal fructose-1,6-bisphosphatase and related enzymes of inositol monophosphatase family
MYNKIYTELIIDAVKQIGKHFLVDFRKNKIPTNKEEFFRQLDKIETTCFDFLKPIIDRAHPNIPWAADDELNGDSQLKPEKYREYWLCDTMDGAVQYIQHLQGWTINLVLVRDGKPFFSVIYDPVADELFSAQDSNGAFLNGVKISKDIKMDPEIMVAVFEYGHQARKINDYDSRIGKNVAGLIKNFGVVRNYGPHALQIAYVGAGRIDLFLQEDLDTHNWLAGILIAKEAGALILTSEGRTWAWGTQSLLVAKKDIATYYLETFNS